MFHRVAGFLNFAKRKRKTWFIASGNSREHFLPLATARISRLCQGNTTQYCMTNMSLWIGSPHEESDVTI